MRRKILLDLTATKSIYNGLGQFCIHLGNAILKNKPSWMDIDLLVPQEKRYLFPNAAGFQDPSRLHEDWVPSFFRSRVLKSDYNLWHVTNQDSRFWPLDSTVPTVFTVHDLNFLREKQNPKKIRYRLKRLQARVTKSSSLVSISAFTRQELLQRLEISSSQVQVIHNGVSPVLTKPNIDVVGVQKPFLFSIGEFLPKKNFQVLLPFLHLLADYTLVIAGKFDTAYGQEFQAQIEKRGLADRVMLLGSVTDEQRTWLYANCAAFLFPSISEGFGLPILEAMSYGKPVFSSNLTSLPEIGGDQAFYWHHFAPEYMLDVFANGMQMSQHDEFTQKMQRHVEQFSWDRAAQSYIALYERLMKDSENRMHKRELKQ